MLNIPSQPTVHTANKIAICRPGPKSRLGELAQKGFGLVIGPNDPLQISIFFYCYFYKSINKFCMEQINK